MEVDIDVGLAFPMLKIVEQNLQPIYPPPSISVRPLGTIHKIHVQTKKKCF
jgi:hypothetical protein